MSIRAKLLTVFLLVGIFPMLLLGAVNYLNGLRTVESVLRADVRRSAVRITRSVDDLLRDRESNLTDLARLRSLREYVRTAASPSAPVAAGQASRALPNSSATSLIPEEVRADVGAFYLNYLNYYSAIACLDARGQTLFWIERTMHKSDGTLEALFEPGTSRRQPADEAVWHTSEQRPLRAPVIFEASGSLVRYSIPIFFAEESSDAPRGVLIVDVKLSELFREAAGDSPATATQTETGSPVRLVIAINRGRRFIYHTNEALKHRPVDAMPAFAPVADAMLAQPSGERFYEDAHGNRWFAAYEPLRELDVRVAVVGNQTGAVEGLRRAGLVGVALSVAIALLAAGLLVMLIRRTTRRIERVAKGAAAIAQGNLKQHIEVRAHDETGLLAESFNLMVDRLRDHIARETETRQFESFMRLSAMLTHDLKNAIGSLSLLVNNMERQFHRAEFRADAIVSLQDAMDKLRGIIARLSEPAQTLSGEHHYTMSPTDLVPLIRRVLEKTAEPSAFIYEIEARLPESLNAWVEAESIERVIENLVINAMEAMGGSGGRLTVEAGQDGEGDGYVFFSVADTGVGMSEEFIRRRLFRPFATTKEKGIGLGLYTCREIVEAHAGRFEVESERGVGTRFRVVLPSDPRALSKERATTTQDTSP